MTTVNENKMIERMKHNANAGAYADRAALARWESEGGSAAHDDEHLELGTAGKLASSVTSRRSRRTL